MWGTYWTIFHSCNSASDHAYTTVWRQNHKCFFAALSLYFVFYYSCPKCRRNADNNWYCHYWVQLSIIQSTFSLRTTYLFVIFLSSRLKWPFQIKLRPLSGILLSKMKMVEIHQRTKSAWSEKLFNNVSEECLLRIQFIWIHMSATENQGMLSNGGIRIDIWGFYVLFFKSNICQH